MEKDIASKIDNLRLPLINVRRTADFPSSTLNYFSLSVGLFMISCIKTEIIIKNPNNKFLISYFLFGGACQYLYGILNWFKGYSIYSFFDFIFSLLFFTIYLKYDYYGDQGFIKTEGVFYILWSVVLLFCIISLKGSNILATIIYVVLFIGFVVLTVNIYIDNKVIGKIYGYCFLVASVVVWIVGIINFISDTFKK